MSDWRKSSRCGTNACVWVDRQSGHGAFVAVADDKPINRYVGSLHASEEEWQVFIAAVKRGEFD